MVASSFDEQNPIISTQKGIPKQILSSKKESASYVYFKLYYTWKVIQIIGMKPTVLKWLLVNQLKEISG